MDRNAQDVAPDSAPIDGHHESMSAGGPVGKLWIPGERAQSLLGNPELVIPFVGAGVAKSAGLVGSAEFSAHLRELFDYHPAEPSDNVIVTASAIAGSDLSKKREVRHAAAEFWIHELASNPSAADDEMVQELVTVPSKLIVTLCYDQLLEAAAERAGVEFETWQTQDEIAEFVHYVNGDPEPDKLTILHLHGRTDQEENIVLDTGGYMGRPSRMETLLAYSLMWGNKTMCFLGTSLDETYLLTLLEQTDRRRGKLHPLFRHVPSTAAGANGGVPRAEIDPNRHGIEVVDLPSYGALPGVVHHLVQRVSVQAAAPRAIVRQAVALDASDYVATVVADEKTYETTEHIDDLARMSVVGSISVPGFEQASALLEEEQLAREHHVLITGAPGSGKTELLRRIGELATAKTQSILIRLHSVPLQPYDPATRLERWALRGESLRGEIPLDSETLRSGTFFFLLDGLDEVSPLNQERVAAQIIELAGAFPQHAFAVTSRTIDANARFSDEAWRRVVLAPGAVWQHRYLEKHGIDLDDLLSKLEGGGELVELLRLPFFLTEVVKRRDQLSGLDLWGVIDLLVDEALAEQRDRDLLPLSSEKAREWLAGAALAMHLAGETTLTTEEVSSANLPSDVEGNAAELCEHLVTRMMLQRRDEAYAFQHRLIGEFLAAEALSEMVPSAELLNAVASELQGISGVRPDWRVPLTFVMAKNPAWREAIRSRDPMQWARGVPSRASREERRAAARTIWDTYVSWDIWFASQRRRDLLSDGSSLTRLLEADDLSDLAAEIRAAIRGGASPRTRGNAMRVLPADDSTGTDLRSDLEAVLEDDAEEAVVRRAACTAAAARGYKELLPLVLRRALDPDDDAELQDAGMAALDLAEDGRELVEIALQLAQADLGAYVELGRLQERLSSSEYLGYLSEFAALDPTPFRDRRSEAVDLILGIPEPTDADIRAAVVLAARWNLGSEQLFELFGEHLDLALEGLGDYFAGAGEEYGWWDSYPLFCLFSGQELEEAGAPYALVELRHSDEERAKVPPEEGDAGAGPEVEEQGPRVAAEAASDHVPLAQLLERPAEEWDETIAYFPRGYAKEVDSLSDQQRADLRDRLITWWPEERFADTVTFTERTELSASWSMKSKPGAWLWFGPALEMNLTPQQWAEIAMSGVLFEEQLGWVRPHSTTEGQAVLASICDSPDSRIWHMALRCIPGKIEPVLAEALVDTLRVANASYELGEIARRLADDGFLAQLQRLAGVSDQFRESVQPFLAFIGDEQAIDQQLDQLLAAIRQGPTAGGHGDLSWLAGIRGREQFLDKLFECLLAAYPRDTQPVQGRRGPQGVQTFVGEIWDPLTPVTSAIRDIGGEAAIRLYDHALATEEGVAFLRLQRDAIADAVLSERGIAAAPGAIEAAGLPYTPRG